jgi:hypothetical protein
LWSPGNESNGKLRAGFRAGESGYRRKGRAHAIGLSVSAALIVVATAPFSARDFPHR